MDRFNGSYFHFQKENTSSEVQVEMCSDFQILQPQTNVKTFYVQYIAPCTAFVCVGELLVKLLLCVCVKTYLCLAHNHLHYWETTFNSVCS